jgi:hypothetical protein
MCGGTGQSIIKIFIDAAEVITPRGKTIQIKLYDAAKNKKFYDFIMGPKDATGYRYYNTGYKGKYTDIGIPLTRQASGPHSIIYDVHEFEKGNPASLKRKVLEFTHNVGRYPTELAIESQKHSQSPSPSPPQLQSKNPRWNRTRDNGSYIVSRAQFKDDISIRSQAALNEKLSEDHDKHNYSESVNFLYTNFKPRVRERIIEHFECEDETEINSFKETYNRMANAAKGGITKRKTKKRKRRNPRKRITYNLKRRH